MGVVVLFVLAVPLSAEAQQSHVARIGIIANGSPPSAAASVDPFRQRLRELGYVEDRNVAIEVRYADDVRYTAAQSQRYRDIAAELAGLGVDVIVAAGTAATRGAKEVTRTVPIVMVSVGDAVRAGLVTSLGRPGGNVTGQSFLAPELTLKGFDLLTEAFPQAKRFGWLFNPNLTREPTADLVAAARARGVTLQPVALRRPGDLSSALTAMGRARPDALLVFAVDSSQLSQVVELAAKNRFPAVYGFREAVDAGGLMSFGPKLSDLWRGAANYVDRILKGAKPGDLPVEQPTTFELVINLKTAKTVGFTIPTSILARADHVIE
jgi:putative ABC transport system substrate-binding protein